MILADTSAWAEFDRATQSPVDLRMAELIGGGGGATGNAGTLAVTEPVVMEVAARAGSDDREADLRRLLGRCALLRFDEVADFDGAARIHRLCRQAGVTPPGLVACMTAAVARRHGAALLAADVDLVRMAAVVGIELDRGSPIL